MSFILFFFSSRRRHTRSKRDWSSDVCSSDLQLLEAHLGLEQLIAQRGIVVHLGLGGGDHLVEDEAKAADQQGVQDEHVRPYALSSLSLMLTKLYGGHGPVYLNVSLSKRAAIAFTFESKADS